MRAFRAIGLMTRRFPAWLQAFNLLCAAAALAILGFGAYHLTTRSRGKLDGVLEGPPAARRIVTEKLVAALEDPARAERLGKALAGVSAEDRARVLDAARAEVRPGALRVCAESLEASDERSRAIARQTTEEWLDALPGLSVKELRACLATYFALSSADSSEAQAIIALRAVVCGDARVRRAGVRRFSQLGGSPSVRVDFIVSSGLKIARFAPPGEEETIEAARVAYERLEPQKPALESIWRDPNQTYSGSFHAPPLMDVRALAARLVSHADSARVEIVRSLGILQVHAVSLEISKLLSDPDPVLRAASAWALGRIGDARTASALAPLLDDRDDNVRLRAAIALAVLGDVRARPALEKRLTAADLSDALKREIELALAKLAK